MIINLSPQRRDDVDALSLVVDGDKLSINGTQYDFGPLPEGAALPATATASEWLVGEIVRVDGVIAVTVILPHGPNPPPAMGFPEPVIAGNGAVTLPAQDFE